MIKPPNPKKKKKILIAHGDKRVDNYYWIRDDKREDTEVINYLKEENKYAEYWFKENKVDKNSIFNEYKAFLPNLEKGFPTKIDQYSYFSTISISSQHRKYYQVYKKRKKLILDVNKLAKGKEYYDISGIFPSRNHKMVAFGEDINGRREYSISSKDIKSNKIIDRNECFSSGKIIWNLNSNGYFYLKKDPKTLITDSLYFHKIGGKAKEDLLIYKENDNEFNLSISASRTKKYLFLQISKTESNEYWILDLSKDKPNLKLFLKRKNKHLYYIDDTPNEFYILSNKDKKPNFSLFSCPISELEEQNWREIIPHSKKELIQDFLCFKDFLVLEIRKKGQSQLVKINLKTKEKELLKFKDSAYTVNLSNNSDYLSKEIFFIYSSLKTPSILFSQNLYSGKRIKRWQQKINRFKENEYETQRIFLKSRDSKKIPVSIIYKKGTDLKNAPILQYGYGSYGSIIEPSFKLAFLPLINRGFIFAIAHIRGGQDLGRSWYDDGRMTKKMNTFFDFIDCTKGLLKRNIGSSKKVYAMGGSAGGLLMGAIINLEPNLYKGIISAVPFVDVLTTMSDESIPLTTFEYKEWGNPKIKKEYFYMKKYSPYDNISYNKYPPVLVTSSLYDSQVQYFEPAKYVPKLRDYNTSNNPILLKMNLIGGHAGKSGRLESLKETAEELSFIAHLATRDF